MGYPDSLEQARQVLEDVLGRTDGVLADPAPCIFVSELASSSVNFTVYFWVEPHPANVLKVSDLVSTGIKLALDAAHIDMPYPHSVVLLHNQAGPRSTLGRVDSHSALR